MSGGPIFPFYRVQRGQRALDHLQVPIITFILYLFPGPGCGLGQALDRSGWGQGPVKAEAEQDLGWSVSCCPSLIVQHTKGSWAPLTNDLYQDIGPLFLYQGTGHGWGLGDLLV